MTENMQDGGNPPEEVRPDVPGEGPVTPPESSGAGPIVEGTLQEPPAQTGHAEPTGAHPYEPGEETGQPQGREERLRSFLENIPEEQRPAWEALADRNNKEDVITRAKRVGIPGDELENILRGLEYDDDTIAGALARKDELVPSEEDIIEVEPGSEEEKTSDDVMSMFNKAKDIHTRAKNGEDVSADVAKLEEEIEEKKRGRLGRWMDKNPGKWNKFNRGFVRPVIGTLLLMAIFYLGLVHALTKTASQRYAK